MVNMLQYYHLSECNEYRVDTFEGRFVLCLSTIIFKTKFTFSFLLPLTLSVYVCMLQSLA